MFIVTCRLDQTVVICTYIKVTLIGVRGKQVRLVITAPRDLPVHRQEIAARIAAGGQKETNSGRAPSR